MNRAELKSKAKESLKGKYGSAIGIIIIFILIAVIASACSAIPAVGPIIPTLVSCVIGFGYLRFFLKISRGEDPSVNELWSCANMWWLYFIISICTGFFVFAWSLLLFIPGIIASYRYRMALYIALDNPSISGLDAIRQSKEMMKGHKWELFVLDLSFIAIYVFYWFICGFAVTFLRMLLHMDSGLLLAIGMIITMVLPSLYIIPYMGVTIANFYNSLKEKNGNTNTNSMNYTQPVGPSSQEPIMTPIDDNFQNQNTVITEQPIQPIQTTQQEPQPFEVPPVAENVVNENTDNTVI